VLSGGDDDAGAVLHHFVMASVPVVPLRIKGRGCFVQDEGGDFSGGRGDRKALSFAATELAARSDIGR